MLARYFPRTTSQSRTGEVNSSSIVPLRCSSASSRIVSMGTMNRNNVVIGPNMYCMVATTPRGSEIYQAKKILMIIKKAAVTT